MVSSEVEAVNAVLALALKEIDEDAFSNWLKEHSVQEPSNKKGVQKAIEWIKSK